MRADCHIHMLFDGCNWKNAIARHEVAPDRVWIRQQLESYASQGFTYLRDGGDRWGVGKCARQIAEEYGIVYRTPLAPLCMQGHYGGFIGACYEDLKQYAQLVRQAKKDGADFIKIMISGIMDFDRPGVLSEPPLPSEQIRQLIVIAHDEGMAVMAHANGASAYDAAVSGVDSVEHGAYLAQETLHAMKENGVVWVPTASTVGNLRGKGRYCEAAVQEIFAGLKQNIACYAKLGGLIAPGTDAGAWAVPHAGLCEYELLTEAGVTEQMLARATEVICTKF